jgi:hypothetical protein
VATGAWPWLSLASFYAMTGPKADDWLVQTVGALVLAVGVALLAGARREGGVAKETRVLGAASAAAFTFVDTFFYLRGHIGAIYLADAAVEMALLILWLVPKRRRAA